MPGLTLDGIDLHTLNFYVTKDDRSPEFEEQVLNINGVNGAISLSERLKSRTITIEGFLFGEDTEISGTVSGAAGDNVLSGSNTNFDELRSGNDLLINNKIYKIKRIINSTSLEIVGTFSSSFSNQIVTLKDYSVCMNNSYKLSELVNSATLLNPKALYFPDTDKTIYVKRKNKAYISAPHVGNSFKATAQKINLSFISHDPYFYGEEWRLQGSVLNSKIIKSDVGYSLINNYLSENVSLKPITNAKTKEFEIIESNGFIIIDTPYIPETTFGVNEYDGYGDVGYIWNLYTEGIGNGYEWDSENPSTALNILTTDTVQDPSTSLTIIDGGFIESSYIWNYNNPSSALEVQ